MDSKGLPRGCQQRDDDMLAMSCSAELHGALNDFLVSELGVFHQQNSQLVDDYADLKVPGSLQTGGGTGVVRKQTVEYLQRNCAICTCSGYSRGSCAKSSGYFVPERCQVLATPGSSKTHRPVYALKPQNQSVNRLDWTKSHQDSKAKLR
eukprot:5023457-Amphidinium_carterae.1